MGIGIKRYNLKILISHEILILAKYLYNMCNILIV